MSRPTTASGDELSRAECNRLLRTHTVGRVAMTSGGLPCILPVCYVYDDGVIVFRTGTGPKLRAAANGDVLAFEVDNYDPLSGQGWSVLVLGRASVITTQHEHEGLPSLDRARDDGALNHYVHLHCELVTGRALEPRSA